MQKIEKENSIAIKMRNKKGVTLIALVVTIVVTLILIAITLETAFGDKGLIKEVRDTQANIEDAQQEGIQKIENLRREEKTIKDGIRDIADSTPPTINDIKITELTNDSFIINLNVTEAESGIGNIVYTLMKDTETIMTETTTERKCKFKDLESDTKYTVKVLVMDAAGNKTVENIEVETL